MVSGIDLSREFQLSRIKDLTIHLHQMLIEKRDVNQYFEKILNTLIDIIPQANLGSILLMDEESRYMTMVANYGYADELAKNFKLQMEETFYYRISGGTIDKPRIINNILNFSMDNVVEVLDNIEEGIVRSSLSCPIFVNGELDGLINIDSFNNNVFTSEDIELMEFLLEQIAIVLNTHRLMDKTVYLSSHDQMTGFYNRWKLGEIESETMKECQKNNEGFKLVMFDLNSLKDVNDNFGHEAGDAYILKFVEVLKLSAEEADKFFRIGGDEFVGVYFNEEVGLEAMLDELNLKLQNELTAYESNTVKPSFSYGIANFPEDGNNLNLLLTLADNRMYEFKKCFKSKYVREGSKF